MVLVKKPRQLGRAAGTGDDVGDFHVGQFSTRGNRGVKPHVAKKHAIECESVQTRGMAHGPRRSRKTFQRGALGGRIRDLRLARGLTQMELAVAVDISRAHVAKIEVGERPPSRDALHAIAKFFDVSMDYLQTGATLPPESGRFVNEAEALKLLALWDAIPDSEKPRILRIISAAALD